MSVTKRFVGTVVSVAILLGFSVAAPAKTSRVGIDWLGELEIVEELVAKSMKEADPPALRSWTVEAMRLIPLAGSLPEPANVHCSMAAQSLANFTRDVFMADADRGKAAGRGDYADYRRSLTSCEKAIGHRIKRRLDARF